MDEQETIIAETILAAMDLVYADPLHAQELEIDTDKGSFKIYIVMETEAPKGTVIQ